MGALFQLFYNFFFFHFVHGYISCLIPLDHSFFGCRVYFFLPSIVWAVPVFFFHLHSKTIFVTSIIFHSINMSLPSMLSPLHRFFYRHDIEPFLYISFLILSFPIFRVFFLKFLISILLNLRCSLSADVQDTPECVGVGFTICLIISAFTSFISRITYQLKTVFIIICLFQTIVQFFKTVNFLPALRDTPQTWGTMTLTSRLPEGLPL